MKDGGEDGDETDDDGRKLEKAKIESIVTVIVSSEQLKM